MPGDGTLRPYYDHDTFNAGYLVIYKPGIGLIDTTTQKQITSSFTYGNSRNKPNMHLGNLGLDHSHNGGRAAATSRSDRILRSSDINYINDLELSEYFDLNNFLELFKNLVWSFFKNYCRVLLSHPLDIVRLTLQVGFFRFPLSLASRTSSRNDLRTETASILKRTSSVDDSYYDDEEIDFFQPAVPEKANITPTKKKRRASGSEIRRRAKNPHRIHPVSQHTVDILSAIAAKDGPFALFRGVNASFIHYTLSHTIEAWITGFLSPFMNIPDPFFLDLTHSTEPAKLLWLSVLACVLTGVILMPLDLIKVRFMITPAVNKPPTSEESGMNAPPGGSDVSSSTSTETGVAGTLTATNKVNTRSVRDSLRHYPLRFLLSPPPSITALTMLHQISTIVFRKSAPYFLFVRYNIDSYLSSSLFTAANLVLLIAEFFIKLPVENLLRKEQVRFLLKPKTREEDKYRVLTIDDPEDLIVDFNGWGEKHAHFTEKEEEEEGGSESIGVWTKVKNLGLFKGWRVGVLNVIGFWGYNIVKTTSVMREERL